MIKWFLNIVLLFSPLILMGQDLNIHLNKEQVEVGEAFTLTYSVISTSPLDTIIYPSRVDVFPGKTNNSSASDEVSKVYELEILKDFKDTTYQENGEHIWKGKYTLIAWDSAFVVLPPELLHIGDSMMYFPAGLIEVKSLPSNPTQPIYDINESFTELPIKNKFLLFMKSNWWWLIIVLAGLAFAIVYFIKKYRKPPAPISLVEQTLKRIDLLEKSKGYEHDLKEYYFDLSIILRRFFAAHYQVRIMDKTTSEVEAVLAEKGLDKSMIIMVRKLLMQSDMVKFAKSVPPLKEVQGVTNEARKVVVEVSKTKENDEL